MVELITRYADWDKAPAAGLTQKRDTPLAQGHVYVLESKLACLGGSLDICVSQPPKMRYVDEMDTPLWDNETRQWNGVLHSTRRWTIQIKLSDNVLNLYLRDRPAIAATTYTIIKSLMKRPSRARVTPAPARSRQPSLAPITRIEYQVDGSLADYHGTLALD